MSDQALPAARAQDAAIAEALRLCACVGSCRGSERLGRNWHCAMEVCPRCNGSQLIRNEGGITICPRCAFQPNDSFRAVLREAK